MPARTRWLAPAVLAAAALMAAACGGSGGSAGSTASGKPATSAPATAASTLKTTTIKGARVLTNGSGFTLYWFVPDTSTTSNCNGPCAQIWPPVKGPATAGTGVTGKLSTIKRSDGSLQAAYDGHPLYTYTVDTAPGQANGDGVNANGGVWHVVPVSGAQAPSPSQSSGPGGGGYGY